MKRTILAGVLLLAVLGRAGLLPAGQAGSNAKTSEPKKAVPLPAAVRPTTLTKRLALIPVDSIVYRAMVASFLENPRQVQRAMDSLTSYDRVMEAQGRDPSGCADNLSWLWAESLATPQARLAGYSKVLESQPDPLVKASIRTAQAQTCEARIRATHHQDTWNRWADLMTALGYNIGRLLNGQMVGSARFLVELVWSPTQFTKVTERERKMWWLMDTALRLDPKGPQAEQLRARMDKMEARFRKDAIRRCMEVAHFYADKAWWDEAYYYVSAAEKAGYRGQKKFRLKVRRAVADRRRWTERSLSVADTERMLRTPEQVQAYAAVLAALTSGNREQLRKATTAAGAALSGTPLADETQDAWSVVFEWAGDRRSGLDYQRDLALRYPESQTGQAALARLDDPHYNPRSRYDTELSRFHRRQARYILTGDRTAKQNVELISDLAAPSVPQLGAAGAFFVTDIFLRSIIGSFGNPVSPEDVLEAGEQMLADPRNGLTPAEQADAQVAVGVLYQKLRRYEEAAAAYRKARILSPELDKQLAEKAADEELRRVLQIEGVNNQVLLLERLIKTYPKTEVAVRARDQLNRLRTESKVDFEIPYDWLAEDPAYWMKAGIGVPYDLMDGSKGNGELGQRGLVFWRDGASSATYVRLDGKKGYVNLTPKRRETLHAAAETWVDQKSTLEEAEIALAKRRLPFEIRGSAGTQGLIVFPTLRQAPMPEDEKQMFR
jgi:tetratricopeptide (TPR) repeat protein